jgi:hypothetical protein
LLGQAGGGWQIAAVQGQPGLSDEPTGIGLGAGVASGQALRLLRYGRRVAGRRHGLKRAAGGGAAGERIRFWR